MNPCPCGYFGSRTRQCTCSQPTIQKYLNRISGPMLDRIDLHVEMSEVAYEDLRSDAKTETSAEIQKRVERARRFQAKRYADEQRIRCNAQLEQKHLKKYCVLDDVCSKLLGKAMKACNLTPRAYARILKVARTIADLECEENIKPQHVAEAIQYRSIISKYWR